MATAVATPAGAMLTRSKQAENVYGLAEGDVPREAQPAPGQRYCNLFLFTHVAKCRRRSDVLHSYTTSSTVNLLPHIEYMFDTCQMTTRPSWWSYPTHCASDHVWGPGLVTVGWMPCECPEAQAENMGHLWVRCRAVEGCSSVWYRPAHSPQPERRVGSSLR